MAVLRLTLRRQPLRRRRHALVLLVVLFHLQLWPEVGGVTLRAEDLLIGALSAAALFPLLFTLRLTLRPSPLYRPLLLLTLAIALSVLVTQFGPYSSRVRSDSVINGVRLLLALAIYPIVVHWPLAAERKVRLALTAIVVVSVATTGASLLQIGYWDGWLPFTIPAVLRLPSAPDAFGKEIFGLFIDNRGTHVWSALLAVQAIVVWIVTRHRLSTRFKPFGFAYFGVLALILLRTSVRNSILGLFVTLVLIELFADVDRRALPRKLVQMVVVLAAATLLLALILQIAPDSLLLDRVRQAIPRYEYGRWTVARSSNIFGRLEAAALGWQMFVARPLLGNGFWSFETLQSHLHSGQFLPHAHNIYIQIIAEQGILGLLAWGWLLAAVARLLLTTRPIGRPTAWISVAWRINAAMLIFLLFSGLFAIPLWQPQQIGLWMLLLAAGHSAATTPGRTRR